MKTIEQNPESNNGISRYKVVAYMITTFVAVMSVLVAILAIKENDNFNEDNLQSASIQCSIVSCGMDECIKIYTNHFVSGRHLDTVIEASNKAKKSPKCVMQDNKAPDANNRAPVYQNGLFNQNNTGSGNSYQNFEVR